MRTISLPFTADETKTLSIPGRMLRVLAGTAGTLDIDFFLGGRTVGEKASGVDAGYFGIPAEGFDRVDITSSSAQTVKLALGRGGGGYDRTVGSVDITNTPSVNVINVPAVTVSGTAATLELLGTVIADVIPVAVGVIATALLAAAPARRCVRFYNDGTDTVFIGGAGVTKENGAVRLLPGATLIERDAPGAAWYGISATAGQSVRIQSIT